MREWQSLKLAEVGQTITGKTPSSRNPEDFGLDMPFITPTDFSGYGKWAEDSERRLSTVGISRLKNKVLPENSVLVTCIGSDMGKVVMNRHHAITNQQINAIVPDSEKTDCDFLYYLLKHNYPTLRSYGETGTAVPILNKGDFEQLEFDFPKLKEQRAIAEVLSSLDDKIDLLHRQNKTLESLAQTLFRQWFIEDADESWPMGRITDLIEFNPPLRLPKAAVAPYVEMADLSTTVYQPVGWRDRPFTSGSKFQNGDTLLARITPCLENGKTAFIDFLDEDQVGWGSTEFIVMRSKGLHPFFSYVLARHPEFRDFAVGCLVGSSGRQRVDLENVATYELKLPPRDVSGRFDKAIVPILRKMKLNYAQEVSLSGLRDSLLPRLMSGEIDIDGREATH